MSFVYVRPVQGVDPWTAARHGLKVYVRGADGGNAHVHGGKAFDGANVTVWDTVNQPNLHWYVVPSSHGGFYLESAVDRNFVLHQTGGSSANDGAIATWNKNTHGHQGNLRVNFEPTSDGYFKITFVHSGKCVHVHGGGKANGTQISQWDFVNQNNLKWSFVPADNFISHAQGVDPWTASRHGFPVYIRGADGGNAHVHGGKAFDGAQVTVWETVNQPNLKWFVVPSTHGGFFLESAVDRNFVLHQTGGGNANDGEISTWNKNTHGHQGNLRVNFEPTSDGYFKISFVHSGKCVHVHGGGKANGTKITQWDFVNQNNLKWHFIPA